MTEKEYGNFELRLEYKMPLKGNSGVGIRSPLKGDPAYVGMEIQLIDDVNWGKLEKWQHTGSIYNVVPAKTIKNKEIGEWNSIKIVAKGRQITIEQNGCRSRRCQPRRLCQGARQETPGHPARRKAPFCSMVICRPLATILMLFHSPISLFLIVLAGTTL